MRQRDLGLHGDGDGAPMLSRFFRNETALGHTGPPLTALSYM